MAVRPQFSVILPTHQGAAWLPGALASVADQTLGRDAVEVIAVDDGSTDETVDLLHHWQDRLNLRVFARPHVGNWVAQTNYGLKQAQGEWICLLHQDDAWLPQRMAQLVALMERYRSVDVFIHPAEFRDPSDRRLGVWRQPFPKARPVAGVEIASRLVLQNTIPIISPVFRRALVERVGALDEGLWYFADWDYWLRLTVGTIWYLHPQPLAIFRVHAGSQTALRTQGMEEIGRQFDCVIDRVTASGVVAVNRSLVAFARAAYLLLLQGFHGGRGALLPFLGAALRVGPIGWWRYLRAARLQDRIGPRVRMRWGRAMSR
jgi:glycosyltransferase involved in cell wall biosynthesis